MQEENEKMQAILKGKEIEETLRKERKEAEKK